MMELKKNDPSEAVGGNPITPQVSIIHRDADDSALTQSSLHQAKSVGVSEVEFQPSRRLYVAFATLSVITLMVALDGTSLSVALPVSLPTKPLSRVVL